MLPSLTSSITSLSTAASASFKDNIWATVAMAEKNTNSAVADAAAKNNVLGVNFAAFSMKRSFEKLSKMDLSVNRDNYQAPDYLFGFGGSQGGGFWGPKEMTQEEKDCLIAFANKNIIRRRGEHGAISDNMKVNDASETAVRGKRNARGDDVKIDSSSPPSQTATRLGEPTKNNLGDFRENKSTTKAQTTRQTSASTLSLTSSIISLSTAASASFKDDIWATVAAAEKNTNSAVADAATENDVLGVNVAPSSMKRSFEKLSKKDLSVNQANYQAPDYLFGSGGSHGGGFWGPKEMAQEEKDCLIAFANKHIVQRRGGWGAVGGNMQDDGASQMTTL